MAARKPPVEINESKPAAGVLRAVNEAMLRLWGMRSTRAEARVEGRRNTRRSERSEKSRTVGTWPRQQVQWWLQGEQVGRCRWVLPEGMEQERGWEEVWWASGRSGLDRGTR
jgi:hypothetical protein